MDCGIAAPSRIAAGSLLKKQAAGIKHSKRAIETGGQRHGALLRTAYSGIRSRRVEAACAVSNSTAPADLVEREVVAVLQDLPGTTFNTLLATLAKSSSGHKISHAELSQALDNMSRRGFVIKDNRGNVKLSKSALTFSPSSPPAPNTAAEDAVARQAIPPETCDEAATAEELQQEILNILEGAPGMTASSLHAQLTKAMRGISLHRDEFMSLLEALSIAGMVIQDKRGNIRLAPSSVGNVPAPVPPPALPHPERRASPAPAPPQPSQSTIRMETNGAESSMQREQQVVKLLQGVAGISTNWLLAELKKQSSDPPWSSQELGELLDHMSEAGRVVRDTRGNIKLAKTPPLTPASSSTAAATAHLDPSPSSWVQEAAGSPRQRAAAAATGPKPATEQEAEGVLGVSLEKEVLGVLEGEAGITFNALLAQLSSRTKRAPKATASELSRVLDVLAAEGQLVRDPRGNLRLVRRKGPQPALPPNNQHHLQQPPTPALPAAADPAGHQLYSWSDQSTDSDFEPDSPVEVEGSAVQAGRASAEQLGVRWWVYDEGADGADKASMSEGSQTEVDEAEEVGEGEEVPSASPLLGGRSSPDPAVQSSAWDLAATFPEAFFDIQGVAQQALDLLQRNHCLGVEQVHALMRDDNGQAHLALWQVDAALCRLHESGLVTCTNEVYSLATYPSPSRDPPPLHTTSAAPLPALHPLHPPRTDPAAMPDQEPSHEEQWSPLLPSEFEGEREGAAEEAEQGGAVEQQWGEEGFTEAAAFGKQWGDEEAVESTAAEQQWGGEGFLGAATLGQQWGEGVAASAVEQDALLEHENEEAAEEEVESWFPSQALPTGAEAGPGPGLLEGSPAEALRSSPQPAELLAEVLPANQAEGDAGEDEAGSHIDSPMLPVEPVAQADTATAHPNPLSATPLVAAGPAVDGGSAAAAKTGRRRSGSATGPEGGLAGAAAHGLTKKERASLVGKRTYALRRLRKEFDAGNMQAEEFAASAAAIEAQYAALLGAPPRPAATKPPSRSSTHGSPSSNRAQASPLKAPSTHPSPPSLAEPSAAIRNRSPDLSAPPMLLSVPGSKRPPRPASPSAHASSATQQSAGSLQPGNRSPSPPSPGTGGLSSHSGQQPFQRSSPPAASAPVSTTSASAAVSNSPSPPAAARPASPAPRSPPETAPARTPLFQRMGSGDSPQPSRPDLRRGSRGASGAAVAMGPGSMSVAARLQALSSGGVGNRSPGLVYGNSGPKQDSGNGPRTPSPPPGSHAAEQSAAPSPLDPTPIVEQLAEGRGRVAAGSERAAAGPQLAEGGDVAGVGTGAGAGGEVAEVRPPSPTASLMAGLAGVHADLHSDAVGMKRKLQQLRASEVEVQALVAKLEASQHLCAALPQAEQEEISRKLRRARGVLAQVQATRQSCGKEIPEPESHSPSPAPPPAPPPPLPTSQRLAASSLTSPRPPPPSPQAPPPPSHPLHPAAKPADQAGQAAAAPFVGQVDLGAPLLGAGATTAPGLNGNHRPDLTTQGPGLSPSTSAPPPTDQEHAGWQEEDQQAQGQQQEQLQLGQQEQLQLRQQEQQQQLLAQQEQASSGVVGKGVGGFSSAGSGAGAGRMMGRLGSMSGLLPDPSDTDTMADLEGLLMMELQQDEELQQAHSQLQAMYAAQQGQGTDPPSQQQVPQGWEGEVRQQQQQQQQQLYQQQQQEELQQQEQLQQALQLQMLQAVEPHQQRELQQEPRSEPADEPAAAPANTTMSLGEPLEEASHKDDGDEGADEAAQDFGYGAVGLGVLGDAGEDLDAAAGDCSIMNLPPPTSGLQPRVRTPTPSRKGQSGAAAGSDSSDRMSRSPVRQHTRSPSLARTAQSSHPGFVVSSSADDADTQPGGEDPQMAIISWSITPPPETHAALAQGPGQPAAEQERVVLVQLALPYKVDFGEVIKVSGNTPEFGSWDIEHAVQMHWTPGNVWVAELRLAPGTYEIKALVRHSTMRDLVRWEEGPNHQLQVPAEPGVLQASWPWSEGPFQQSFEPTPGSQPAPPPSQPGQQGGGEGRSGNRRGWGGGEGGGGGGGGAGVAAWGYPKGRPGQGDAVVGRRPPAPGQANSIIITNHRGSVIQASRVGGMAAQMLEQAHHRRLEAEAGGRGWSRAHGLQATLPPREMGQATGRASGLTSNNVLASTGLRGARTVAPASLSRSLLLTPARLLLVQDAVAYKQQQGVLLGPPALGQGGGLGASVGRAVSPGRAGCSGLWLPECWEGRLGARHAAGKGQSSSSSLVPVGLGKLLDPRRHLPNSQDRFKAMEGKQGDRARLPHQLLLLPNTHSPKAWVHHNSRQSRAITQPATPHQKVMLALSGPGQPALIGCGPSLQPPLLLTPSTSTPPVPLTVPLPASSLPAPSFTPSPVRLLTAAAATKLEPALHIAHVLQGELTTLHASRFTTVQHTALGLQHATVVPSQQPPVPADLAAATLPSEATVQGSPCLQAARPEDGSMVAGGVGPFQLTSHVTSHVAGSKPASQEASQPPQPASQPAPPSGQPGQQGWGVQGQGNSYGYDDMPMLSAAPWGAPLVLAATAIHGATAGTPGPGAEGSSLPAPQPCSPSSETSSNSTSSSNVVSTGNNGNSPRPQCQGSLLEQPEPSPRLPVSFTPEALGLGCIFQAAVLQAAVQAAGQSPQAAPGRVEHGCCSPPSSSQVADDTAASPARQMWLDWVQAGRQAVQAAAGEPGLGLQEDWVEAAGQAVQSAAGERGQAPSWRVIREEGPWSRDRKDEQEGEIERVPSRVSSPPPQQTERPLEMMPSASHCTSQIVTHLPIPPSTTLNKLPPQDARPQPSPAAEPAAPCSRARDTAGAGTSECSHSLPSPFLVDPEKSAEDCCHGDEHHRGHGRAPEMRLREEVGHITSFLSPPPTTQLVLNSVPGLYQQLLALPPPSERWDSRATPAKVWSNLAPDTRPGQPNAQPGLAQTRVQYLLPACDEPLPPCDEAATHNQHQEVTRVWGNLAASSPPPVPGSNLSHSSSTLAATSPPTTLDHKLEGSLQEAPLPLVLACHQLQTVALTDSARHTSKPEMVREAEDPDAKQLGGLHHWGQQAEQLDNQSQLMGCGEVCAHLLAAQEQAPRASSQLAVLGAGEPALVSLATDTTAKAGEAQVQVEQKQLAGQWVDLVAHVGSGQQCVEIHVQDIAQVGDLMWQQAQQQAQQQVQQQAQQQAQQHSLVHSSSEAQEVQQVVCDLVQVLRERPVALPAALVTDLRQHEEQVHDLVRCNQPPSPGPAVLQLPPSLLPMHWPTPAQPSLAGQRSPSPGYEQALEAVAEFVEGANMERSRRSPSVSHTVASEVVSVGHGHNQLPVESADPRSLAGSSGIGQVSPVGRSSPGAETSEAALYSSGDNSNGWVGSPAKPSSIAMSQACNEGVMVDICSAGSRGRGSKEASPSPSKLSPPRQSPGRSSPSPAGVRAGQVVAQLSMSCSLPPHQVVRFVGGRPEFGAWDLAASPALTCNDQDMWQASVALQPGYYQFKLVVLDNNSGEAVWEPGPMRALTVPEEAGGGLLILHCTWCDYEMEALFLWDPVAPGAGPGAGSMLYKQARTLHCEATMDIEGME